MNAAPHVTAASDYLAQIPKGPARSQAYESIKRAFDANRREVSTKISRLARSTALKRARDTGTESVREVALVAIVHWRGLLNGSAPWPGREK